MEYAKRDREVAAYARDGDGTRYTGEAHGRPHAQQHEHAPAQPHQCRPQVRGGAEGDAKAAADREVRGDAHRALRYQRERDAGQRKGGCSARWPRRLPLRLLSGGAGARTGESDWRGDTPPARANRMRARVVQCGHACPSWQQAAAAGLLAYSSCRFTHSTILPSGPRSFRPFGVRSRK